MPDSESFGLAILAAGLVGVVAVLSSRASERLRIPAPAFFLIGAALASDIWPALGHLSFGAMEQIVQHRAGDHPVRRRDAHRVEAVQVRGRGGDLDRDRRHPGHRRGGSAGRARGVLVRLAGLAADRDRAGPHRSRRWCSPSSGVAKWAAGPGCCWRENPGPMTRWASPCSSRCSAPRGAAWPRWATSRACLPCRWRWRGGGSRGRAGAAAVHAAGPTAERGPVPDARPGQRAGHLRRGHRGPRVRLPGRLHRGHRHRR